jgi:uncharacterized membrane protein YhaH (DUF805 family)
MFKNPFSFEGRIRRLEYGLSYILYIIIYVPLLIYINQPGEPLPISLIIAVIILALFWFMLAQGAKRCHDRGNSGWWQIIPFYHLWMLFGDGEIGPNDYGDNPKGLEWDYRDDEEDSGDPAKPIDDVDEVMKDKSQA